MSSCVLGKKESSAYPDVESGLVLTNLFWKVLVATNLPLNCCHWKYYVEKK